MTETFSKEKQDYSKPPTGSDYFVGNIVFIKNGDKKKLGIIVMSCSFKVYGVYEPESRKYFVCNTSDLELPHGEDITAFCMHYFMMPEITPEGIKDIKDL